MIRFAYGTLLTWGPPGLLSVLAGEPLDRAELRVARILGVRQLAQAELLRRHPGRRWRLLGAAVDGLHAASMIAVGAARPRPRRPALRDAVLAGAFAAAGALSGRR